MSRTGGQQPIDRVLAELVHDHGAGPSPESEELGVIPMVGEVEPVVTVDVQGRCDIRVKFGATT